MRKKSCASRLAKGRKLMTSPPTEAEGGQLRSELRASKMAAESVTAGDGEFAPADRGEPFRRPPGNGACGCPRLFAALFFPPHVDACKPAGVTARFFDFTGGDNRRSKTRQSFDVVGTSAAMPAPDDGGSGRPAKPVLINGAITNFAVLPRIPPFLNPGLGCVHGAAKKWPSPNHFRHLTEVGHADLRQRSLRHAQSEYAVRR